MIQDYKESSKKYRELKNKINMFLAIFVVIFILTLISTIKIFVKNNKENESIKKIQEQAQKIENENQEIQTLIDNYNLDTSKEKIAREKLNMMLPGEEVVVINNNKNEIDIKIPVKTHSDNYKNLSNFQKWLKIFFKK